MIGNDVIDLRAVPNKRIVLEKRRLEKLCTSDEIRFILQSENPNETFWNIWTKKEACYKAYQRINYIHSFCPQQIENEMNTIENLITKVHFRNTLFFAETTIKGVKLHSVCADSQESLKEICVLDDLEKVRYLYDFHKDANGIPSLQTKNGNDCFPISKSSHGAFTMYAFFKKDKKNRNL